MQQIGDAVRRHEHGDNSDRVEARRGQGQSRHQPTRPKAHGQPDSGATDKLREDQQRNLPGIGNGGTTCERADEHDDRGVVEACFALEQRPQARDHVDSPQHAEDGSGIRRRQHGRQEQRQSRLHPRQPDERHRDDGDADREAHRCQHDARPQHRAQFVPARGEPAVGQDDDERGIAQHGREPRIAELHRERGPEDQADEQVDEEARDAEAAGEAHADDRDEHDDGARHDRGGEVVECHGQPLSRCCTPSEANTSRVAVEELSV